VTLILFFVTFVLTQRAIKLRLRVALHFLPAPPLAAGPNTLSQLLRRGFECGRSRLLARLL